MCQFDAFCLETTSSVTNKTFNNCVGGSFMVSAWEQRGVASDLKVALRPQHNSSTPSCTNRNPPPVTGCDLSMSQTLKSHQGFPKSLTVIQLLYSCVPTPCDGTSLRQVSHTQPGVNSFSDIMKYIFDRMHGRRCREYDRKSASSLQWKTSD